MKAISIYDVLDLCVRKLDLEVGAGDGQCVLRYDEFWTLLITEEVTTSERKCKELWKAIGGLGLGRKVNQSKTYIIGIEKLGDFLAHKFPSYREQMDRSRKALRIESETIRESSADVEEARA